MNATMFFNWIDWMSDHYPDLAGFVIFVSTLIWLTAKAFKFISRFTKTEQLCLDIHDKKLPAIDLRIENLQKDMDKKFEKIEERIEERFVKVDRQFAGVNEQLTDIKLMIKKIDTYLSTTSNKYPGS
jgi:hypothetical protein